jgi:hypothetical protein
MADDKQDPDERLAKLLLRAAHYDGRVEALTEVNAAFMEALARFEAVGPMPEPDDNPLVILQYQVRVASAAGGLLRELGAELKELLDRAEEERQIGLRDKDIDLDGGAMH